MATETSGTELATTDGNPGLPAAADDRFALFKELGASRLLALGAILLAVIAFLTFVGFRVAQPNYTLLFGQLDAGDVQDIMTRLDDLQVPYRLSRDGTAVMVPEDRALRLRLTMAEEGLPSSGTVGYEIFDDTSPLGTTQFQSNLNLVRALEGELGRTIASMAPVRSARVHLVLPKRELFQRERIEPSASIALSMRGGSRLNPTQVAAIQQMVAGAVPGLSPERITVVDDKGALLARNGGDEGQAVSSRAEEYRRSYEQRLADNLTQLLERPVGYGKVHVSVAAEMNFDEITETSETFDPDSQVARSTRSVEEESELAESEAETGVSVQNNLPAANQNDVGSSANERTLRTEEIVNYEISRTVRNHTQAGGNVKRLSIAVLVDGTYAIGADGSASYQPRPQDELDQLAALVRGAAGVDVDRGDVVEIINRPFATPPQAEIAEPGAFDFSRGEWMRIAEIASLVVGTLLVILLVVRPTLARVFPAKDQPALETAAGVTVTHDGDVLIEPGSEAEATLQEEFENEIEERLLEIDQVSGQIRASLITQVEEMIDEQPEEAVRAIRAWLQNQD
ncbi:MAG: flagellar basal-body MS-ring/collar protein FliF [Geminicoccaceae bacterium]